MASPWGDTPPRRPATGAGRAALAKRARARGGAERRASAEAARRGLSRGRSNRRARRRSDRPDGDLLRPVRRGWGFLVQHSRHFRQRFLLQRRIRHLVLAVAVAWAAWTFLLGDAGVPRLLSLKHQNGHLEREIGALEAEQARLEAEVKALAKGDRTAIERVARDEHAMVRDGEVLVRFYVPEEEEE
jgi:cell division protein FtsB